MCYFGSIFRIKPQLLGFPDPPTQVLIAQNFFWQQDEGERTEKNRNLHKRPCFLGFLYFFPYFIMKRRKHKNISSLSTPPWHGNLDFGTLGKLISDMTRRCTRDLQWSQGCVHQHGLRWATQRAVLLNEWGVYEISSFVDYIDWENKRQHMLIHTFQGPWVVDMTRWTRSRAL